MTPPRLDFLASPARPAPWTWALLAAGLLAAAWAGLDYQEAANARATAAERLARQQPATSRPARPQAGAQARETALREARARLDAPWNELLATLQDSRPDEIALQSLEADAHKGGFRLEAETRRHGEMLDYLDDLRHRPALGDVALIRHEALDVEGERVIGFSLGGLWRRP